MGKIILFGLLLLSIVEELMCHVDYTGHKLYGLFARDEGELEFLRQLLGSDEVDIWKFPTGLDEKMTVRLAPEYTDRLEKDLKSNNIEFYVVHDNVQKLIDDERKENSLNDRSSQILDDFPLNIYHNFQEIIAYMDGVASRYEDITALVNLGASYENNPLKGLKIGKPGIEKPAIWIDAGIHAREWIAPATALYIIDQFLEGYHTNLEIKELLDTFDWYIFPVINPDGYIYTWMQNRLWRKNRSPLNNYPLFSELLMKLMNVVYTYDTLCFGVDLNRNFDASFGGNGSSSDPCTNNYHGISAFSEAESKAIRDGVLKLGSNLKAYLSLHSFAQAWMSPYARTEELPRDYDDHMKVLGMINEAISKVHGENYTIGPARKMIGVTMSGNTVDWMYDVANVKYSFGVELRYSDDYFMPPRSQIIPTAEENFAGIKALAKFIHSELQN